MSIPHRNRVRGLALLAGLPLLCLPLRAAEPPRPAADEPPAAPEQPAPQEGQDKPAPAEGQAPPPKAAVPAEAEEKVSLDNNLSFPVDI